MKASLFGCFLLFYCKISSKSRISTKILSMSGPLPLTPPTLPLKLERRRRNKIITKPWNFSLQSWNKERMFPERWLFWYLKWESCSLKLHSGQAWIRELTWKPTADLIGVGKPPQDLIIYSNFKFYIMRDCRLLRITNNFHYRLVQTHRKFSRW